MNLVPLSKDSNTDDHSKRMLQAIRSIRTGESRRMVAARHHCALSSISRGVRAALKGYPIGKTGHRQKMNEWDEACLERWIVDMINHGETVFSTSVIKMVCYFYN